MSSSRGILACLPNMTPVYGLASHKCTLRTKKAVLVANVAYIRGLEHASQSQPFRAPIEHIASR